jgi:hypothetical protein
MDAKLHSNLKKEEHKFTVFEKTGADCKMPEPTTEQHKLHK